MGAECDDEDDAVSGGQMSHCWNKQNPEINAYVGFVHWCTYRVL